MVLVSDVLDLIVLIYSPLNLANIKIQILKFVRNTAPDNQRVVEPQTGAYSCLFYF